MSEFTWRIADQSDFHPLYSLIYNSDDRPRWDLEQIKRRILIPLFLEQLIVFEDEHDRLSAFLTYALMDGQSACHQATLGVLPADWRSGKQLWVVDFLSPFGCARQMLHKLRRDCSGATEQPVRYFRLKTKNIKRISLGEKI